MKLMKIFGMVLAFHVLLVTVVLLIQGCRSTTEPSSAPTAPPVAAAPATMEPVAENWSSQPIPSYGGASALGNSSYGSDTTTQLSPEPLSSLTPAERARTAPQRPANPDAYISSGSSPAALGQSNLEEAPAGPATYTVRSGDSFWKIAQAHGTTDRELQRLNPDLKANALRPGDVVKLPPSAARRTAPGVSTAPSGSAVASAASSSTYTVKSGDSLSRIAAANGTTVTALREANNIRGDMIRPGQELTIPGGSTGNQNDATTRATPSAGQISVTLQPGETLGGIAVRYRVSVAELMAANNISDPRRVRAGRELVIPGSQAVTPPSSSGPATGPDPESNRSAPPPPAQPAPPPAPSPSQPPAELPPDLDTLIPPGNIDAPVVPIDEPTPAP